MWQTLNQLLIDKQYTPNDIALIQRAYEVAAKAHDGQKRASGEAYISHPAAVATYLIAAKLDAPAIAAAMLHDVCEDTSVTLSEIRRDFGEEIAFLVEGVSKVKKIRYREIQRIAEPLRNMFIATAKDVRVILIKLFDRLHNMQTLSHLTPEKQTRIAKETLELYASIANRLGMGELKGQLEDLAFPFVYPKEYQWITKEHTIRAEKLEHYLQKLMPVVCKHLIKDHVPFINIHSRVKHLYSLWQKLLRNDMNFENIYDVSAVRIIVPAIEDCYAALGIIHNHWRPLPGRIKDYIAFPKPNGYQSLHTTVFCPRHHIVEFQIRTPEMHEHAEFGIAAHWAYKENASMPDDHHYQEWITKFRNWQKEGKEFFSDRIFVLTPKGEVFDLPRGATPLDFAYHVHSEVGNRMTGAKINGKLVVFGKELASGDAVEIVTHHRAKPKAEWLEHARTTLARRHIHAALRKLGIRLPQKRKEKTPTELMFRIHVKDRVGLLRDLSSVFSENHINIVDIHIEQKHTREPIVVIRSAPKKSIDINQLVTKIKLIRGVKTIEFSF